MEKYACGKVRLWKSTLVDSDWLARAPPSAPPEARQPIRIEWPEKWGEKWGEKWVPLTCFTTFANNKDNLNKKNNFYEFERIDF